MAEVSGPANGQHIICHLNYVGKGPIQYIVARHSDFTPSTSLAKNARDRTFLPNFSISWKTLAFGHDPHHNHHNRDGKLTIGNSLTK